MLQVFRRLLFCGVLRNGEYSSERKPLYQVEYKESEDGDDVLYNESDPGNFFFKCFCNPPHHMLYFLQIAATTKRCFVSEYPRERVVVLSVV
ncbi:hypothetical protein TNIN_86251 [Trichonephila inaurata madagascariensis]|uniref:Uncharacterized protein n=1 Tax=Trichonephila inaurata madagascariensis TaxID=2747483 RepID=A0A8X7CQV9_9ARAC|nr:hypothetical protein TNIN_86251 [Trichonephila inaurata madagascariensis]